MIAVNDLNLEVKVETKEIELPGGIKASVRSYLPIDEKTKLIQYVVAGALDPNTGCFSPVRTEVYFALGVCRWYADIMDEDLTDAGHTYDLLETSGVLDTVIAAIPEDEYEFMTDLVKDTTEDIARYLSSAAGVIESMSKNAGTLKALVDETMDRVKDREGIELIAETAKNNEV